MRKGTWKTWFLIVLAVALLAGAAWRIPSLSQLRDEYELETTNPFEDAAVVAEFPLPTVALFTFRSLAIDYLWLRADTLKTQGQYFDALHLAQLICRLQPNLPRVWDFQAWNMAYNISVAMPTCPERWHWVEAAINLLRDQGLYYNPQDSSLHHSIGWMFQHKIGGIADDCHRFYKLKLAYEMTRTIGTTIMSNSRLAALAAAPDTWDELMTDPEVSATVEMLQEVEPKFADRDVLLQGMREFRTFRSNYSPELHQFIADNAGESPLSDIASFAHAKALREKWKMDPNLMLEINLKYGPIDYENNNRRVALDWRLPYTHAIYWAVSGRRYTSIGNADHISLSRMINQNLKDLFHYGNLQLYTVAVPDRDSRAAPGQEVLSPSTDFEMRLFVGPDLRMFPIAYAVTLDNIKMYNDAGIRVPSGMEAGAIGMARTAIINLYLTGHRKMARKYYLHLREKYPARPDYVIPLTTFIEDSLLAEIGEPSAKFCGEYINGLLRQAYASYAVRDDDNAKISEVRARKIRQIVVNKFNSQGDRLMLPQFGQMQWLAMKDFLSDPTIIPEIKQFLLRRLEVEDPEKHQRVIEFLRQQRRGADEEAANR